MTRKNSYFISKIHQIDTILDQPLHLPTFRSILFRAIIAFIVVFVFMSALQSSYLSANQYQIEPSVVHLGFAFITSLVHITIWAITILIYKNSNTWNALKSLFLKCFIAFSILGCMYFYAQKIGLSADLAFFIRWGLIMSPSFAFGLILYEIYKSAPTNIGSQKLPTTISPIFQLSSTDSFLYAITCKKASSLDATLNTLSNGIFVHFETGVKLQNTTLTNFLRANSHFAELVRCHDSYVINLQKVQQFDQEQGLLLISQKQVPISKKGGKGIASIAEISEKITSYTRNK